MEVDGKAVPISDEQRAANAADLEKAVQELRDLEGKQGLEKRIEQHRETSSFRINDINIRNRQFQKDIEERVGGRSLTSIDPSIVCSVLFLDGKSCCCFWGHG